jgi:hypothetical protein
MFVAYVDESGHSEETEFFSLAASVADWPVWRVFNTRWNQALVTHGAPYLHMREFAHSLGPFKGWTESRRRELMRDCLAAAEGLNIVHIAAAMRVADYRKLDPESQKQFVDPTFCCFQTVMNGVSLNAYLDFPLTKTDVVYSRQDEYAGMLRKLYGHMTQFWRDGQMLGVLAFQNMRASPGLQLADLVAYEFRHYYHLRATRPELSGQISVPKDSRSPAVTWGWDVPIPTWLVSGVPGEGSSPTGAEDHF